MTTWHTYGYGICTDEITTKDVKRLENLLEQAPDYNEYLQESLQRHRIEDPTWEDYMEADEDYNLGLPTILREVIEEAEGIELEACDDFEGRRFLLYCPRYPWHLSVEDSKLTEDRCRELFEKYIRILTDEKLNIDYQSVQNGG